MSAKYKSPPKINVEETEDKLNNISNASQI